MLSACGEACDPDRERALAKACREFAAARVRKTFSHGPICGLLGLVCMANAYVGLRLRNVPYRVFWGLDGVLKIVAGVTMVLISFGS